MEIGIIGLPKSGKTTVFNALTKGEADIDAHAKGAPNVGVVRVPDPRLDGLDEVFHPKRKVPAEVRYVDVGVPPTGLGKTEGLGGQFFAHMSVADALLHVVRVFSDDTVPHIEGSVDPARDIDILNTELVFSDLSILDKRLQKIDPSLKSAKPEERDGLAREQALLTRIKTALQGGVPVREQHLSDDEAKLVSGYQLLTGKPLLLVANIGEESLPQASSLEEEWRAQYVRPDLEVAALCGKLEMELAQLDDDDAREFRSSMGVDEAALHRMVRLSYRLLGLISFFTVVSDEVKAWTIKRDTSAARAAGKVHSDMERGFIRAEVIGYDDLVRCGGIAEARKRGLVHVEGKNYTVSDGDVITFLFNV